MTGTEARAAGAGPGRLPRIVPNHDLCYQDHVRGKEACDQSLRNDMGMNCGCAFDQDDGHKDPDKFETCYRIAATYHHGVKRKGTY